MRDSLGAPGARSMIRPLTSILCFPALGNGQVSSEELPPLAGDVDVLARQLRHASFHMPEGPLRVWVVKISTKERTRCHFTNADHGKIVKMS